MKAEEAEITLNLKHFLPSCGLPHHLNAPGVCLTDAAWRFGLDSHNPIRTLFSPTLVSNREPTLMLTALCCSRRRSEIVIYLGLSGESTAFWSWVTSVSESCQFVLMILQDILWLNVNGLFYYSIILFSSCTKPALWQEFIQQLWCAIYKIKNSLKYGFRRRLLSYFCLELE